MRNTKFLALIPALLLCAAPTLSQAAVSVGISVGFAPPELPVYEQPPLPAPGYIWTPGYWAWDGSDYYWVPGTWVEPPSDGMLWTPGYWGWQDGAYVWNDGYWAPTVGFYGGVDYGFGYTGVGYEGGYWHGGAFFYNRAVANFGTVNIVNVYNTPVHIRERTRVSFNGGEGGLRARPTVEERRVIGERHIAATGMQLQQQQHARSMPELHAKQNGGRPQILTTARAGDFAHPGPGAGLHDHQQNGPQNHGAGPQVHEGPRSQSTGAGPAMRGPDRSQGAAGPAMRGGPAPQSREPERPREQPEQREQAQPLEQRRVQPREQPEQQRVQPRQQPEPREQTQPREQNEQRQPREQVQQHEQAPRAPAEHPQEGHPAESRAQPKHEGDDKKDR